MTTKNNSHPLKVTWDMMHQRCYNENATSYPWYGARGIKVSNEWHDFNRFVMDMGDKPSPEHTLDRINSDGDYSASNCRWATLKEQAANRRPPNSLDVVKKPSTAPRRKKMLSFQGETLTQREWSQKLGIPETTLSACVRRGWPVEKILRV